MIAFFHSPNSCSEGIRLLLREAGADVDLRYVRVGKQENRRPEFLALNPKGKVPAVVRTDGSILTEFPAIAFWIARTFPEAQLVGATLEDEVRALELVDFIVSSLHMRAFTFLKVPQKFHQAPEVQEALAAFGRAEAIKGFDYLAGQLDSQEYLSGCFGIADAAAWYVLRWAIQEQISLPENLQVLHDRIALRPSAIEPTESA
jgi:glutathione S-transferase